MSFKVSSQASEEDKHGDDVECCVFMKNHVLTGSDDGTIKVWTADLILVSSWSAHEYVVYDLSCDHDNSVLYSCSMDGEIKMWSLEDVERPRLIATAIQTGPTGEGADLGGMGGGAASLEHEPVTVRKLLFKDGVLWAGDEMGSLCRWSHNLSTFDLKKEYYTEIWSLAISLDNNTVYTVRDNEIIVADVSNQACGSNSVRVNYTIPGRAPVVLDSNQQMLFSPTRGGMDIQVRNLDVSKFKESNILKKHDMIVNTLLVDGDLLLSAGWDSRLLIWEKKASIDYKMKEEVKLESYINTMCSGQENSYYLGGKKGYLVKVSK